MSILDDYDRCTRRLRCPVCLSSDWCMVSKDRTRAICPRSPEGSVKSLGEAGYLHILSGAPSRPQPAIIRVATTQSHPDLAPAARRMQDDLVVADAVAHAEQLGISPASLFALGMGYDTNHEAWSFPMRDAAGRIIGIRLRRESGFKWAVAGSRNGLFFSQPLDHQVVVCEGPTDTAAMLDLGFCAVGRPFCMGGVPYLVTLLARKSVVIVSDNDGPGVDGAERLGDALLPVASSVKIIFPTRGKDAREWKRLGATSSEVRSVIASAVDWTPRTCKNKPSLSTA